MTEYRLPMPYPPYDDLNMDKVVAAMMLLQKVGIDLSNVHSGMAPYRLTHYLGYLQQGAPEFHLTTFPNEDPVVTSRVRVPDITFWSACSHHCLPFFGTVEVNYVPDKVIAGLSKIPLVVRSVAQGFWMQEHLVNAIADRLQDALDPKWLRVEVKARHTCQLLDLKQPPIPVMEIEVERFQSYD